MEPSFYEHTGGFNPGTMGHHQLKQRSNLTLDLNYPVLGSKAGGKQLLQHVQGSGVTPLLNSPELMKLNTPEFEKLVMAQQEGLISVLPTPTTTQIYLGGQQAGKQGATEEQEAFTKGFENALNELHHSDSSQEPSSYHGATYTNLEPSSAQSSSDSFYNMVVKDEPQKVPSVTSDCSPAMSPIDMESQERIKLERKRQRNRVAASKCRKRKLERISRLEDKVKVLKNENGELGHVLHRLKEHVCRLKEQVMDHVHSGCQIVQTTTGF